MDPLQYQCPYCTGTIAVDLESVGGQVVCPHCQRPVKIDPPSARLLDPHASGSTPHARSQDAETTIATVHPVMFRARPFSFLLLLAFFVVGLLLLIVPGVLLDLIGLTLAAGAAMAAGGVLMAIGVLGMLIWYVKNLGTTLTVTTKRTRLVRGLISKHSTEVQHDDVRNIQVRQSLVQRMIGVGDLAISSSGQDDLEIAVAGIPSPEDIADEVRKRQ